MKRLDPIRPLLFALRSPSPADRLAAALALNRRSTEGPPETERRSLNQALLLALRDPNAQVRRLAEVGLEEASFRPSEVRKLIQLTKTAGPSARAAGCRILKGLPGGLPALTHALKDHSPQVKQAARQALEEVEGTWKTTSSTHQTPIEAIDISPDGRLLTSGCQEGLLVLWDLRTGGRQLSLQRPGADAGGISGLGFNDRSTLLAVGDFRGATFLDPTTGRIITKRDRDKAEIVFGHRLLGVENCGVSHLRFMDGQGRWLRKLKLPEEAWAFTVSADLSAIAVRSDAVSVLDARTGQVRCKVPGRGEFGASELLALSPDGSTLATADGYGQDLRLWNARSGQPLAAWTTSDPLPFRGVLEFSPDGNRLAFGSSLLDIPSGQWLWREMSTTWVRAARFTPDGAFLATAGDDHVATLWDASTGRKERTFGVPRNEIGAICVSARGTKVAAGYESGTIGIWDSRRQACVKTIEGIPGVRSLSFSPSGNLLVCAGEESYAKLFNHAGAVRELRPWVGRVTCTAWSERENLVALGGRNEESAQLGLYNTNQDTFTPLPLPLSKARQGASDLTFSVDGKFLAGTLDGTPLLWTLDDPRPRCLPKLDWTCGLAFSPDGRWLAGGTTGYEIVIWDVERFTIRDILRARSDTPSQLAFSTDGRRLAFMTSYSSDVEVRDVTTGARLALLRKHAGNGRAIAFMPGGRLVTGAADGRLIFWPSK